MTERDIFASSTNALIRVNLGSGGSYLLLTQAEYVRALQRGKNERRHNNAQDRIDAKRARDEAAGLGWIWEQ